MKNLFAQDTQLSFEDRFLDQNVFIRTVTHYFVGHVVGITEKEIYLDQCAWVAETARWSETLRDGKLNEVECYPPDLVNAVFRAGIIDVVEWRHELPKP